MPNKKNKTHISLTILGIIMIPVFTLKLFNLTQDLRDFDGFGFPKCDSHFAEEEITSILLNKYEILKPAPLNISHAKEIQYKTGYDHTIKHDYNIRTCQATIALDKYTFGTIDFIISSHDVFSYFQNPFENEIKKKRMVAILNEDNNFKEMVTPIKK